VNFITKNGASPKRQPASILEVAIPRSFTRRPGFRIAPDLVANGGSYSNYQVFL
jgi:hypothetical protein